MECELRDACLININKENYLLKREKLFTLPEPLSYRTDRYGMGLSHVYVRLCSL
jgi:hypothetical protein